MALTDTDTVRAYRAVIGLDIVLWRNGRPVAWRIGGAGWKWNEDESRDIVARFPEVDVPDWAGDVSGADIVVARAN